MAQGIHLSLLESWSSGKKEQKEMEKNRPPQGTLQRSSLPSCWPWHPVEDIRIVGGCGAMHHGWGRWVDVGQLKVYSVLCPPPSWGAIPYTASDQAAAPIQSAASRLRSRPIFRYDLPPPMGRASGCCRWMVIEGEIEDTCCRRWDSEIELEGSFIMHHGYVEAVAKMASVRRAVVVREDESWRVRKNR